MNFSDLKGEREGSGSNNSMSLWTWPWNKSRRLLRRPRQANNPQHRQQNSSTATKYNKCALLALALLLGVGYWEETHADYLYMIDLETRAAFQENNNHPNHNNKLSLAVLVAGSTQRFLFDSFVEHVSKTNHNVDMDYFAILTLKSGPAFRQDAGYMGHLAGRDKLFQGILDGSSPTTTTPIGEIRNQMQEAMVEAVNPNEKNKKNKNNNIMALRLLEEPIEDDPILDTVRQHQETILGQTFASKDDVFGQFPMMDKREKALARTKAGNKNMIRLFLALESLWDTEFLESESKRTTQYDYVLILRDDTLWLDDFDLHRVIATDPTADAYILSCDARTPKMLPPEVNDHGILVKRNKAQVLGKYVTAMASLNLQDCHASVQTWLGTERGCNSEMILKHVLEKNEIKVKLVPQSILPFERAVLIDKSSSSPKQDHGDDFYCYHKFCQSVDQPLTLPSNIQRCKDLTF